MPSIAAGVKKSGAQFYWHLGDFRKITDVDEDIDNQPQHLGKPLSKPVYERMAWNDFVENQIQPFGTVQIYLGIGNHDTTPPKTRAEFVSYFSRWLDTPELRAERLRDDPTEVQPRSYYRWFESGVDFINLDNATTDQFSPEQIAWFEKVLHSDSSDSNIHTIVVGMHEALPESISANHSMDQSPIGIESGRHVYIDLLRFRDQTHKRVYVLASHSHYFMDGIFNTPYWHQHGGVLPGWIVGTAGAERYSLPKEASEARVAQTNVYGFLLANVSPNGAVEFNFQPVMEKDVTPAVATRYAPGFIHWCFAHNSSAH